MPSPAPGAVAHFIMEALYAGRDGDDALLRDLTTVTPLGGGRLEVTLAGQRLEVTVRAATPGYYPAEAHAAPNHLPTCVFWVTQGDCDCGNA